MDERSNCLHVVLLSLIAFVLKGKSGGTSEIRGRWSAWKVRVVCKGHRQALADLRSSVDKEVPIRSKIKGENQHECGEKHGVCQKRK